jgi:hypothetical protein
VQVVKDVAPLKSDSHRFQVIWIETVPVTASGRRIMTELAAFWDRASSDFIGGSLRIAYVPVN